MKTHEIDSAFIKDLESLIELARMQDCDVSSIQKFFDVGEWKIAFEGLEMINQEKPDIFQSQASVYLKIKSSL